MSRKRPREVRLNDHLTHENYVRKTGELYDSIAEWYVQSFWNDETDSDWIKLCMSTLSGKRTILDIGSGPGNYARFFMEASYDVTCMDISAEMMHKAMSRLPAVVGVVGDMRYVPFDNERFDCVLCAYSINHIIEEDFQGTLHEFGRVLRPGGILCLMLKTGSISYEFSNSRNPKSRGVMCLFCSDAVIRAVRTIGVLPIQVRYKDEASASEFQHEKMLIVGSKL